jgi:hypothetical protein
MKGSKAALAAMAAHCVLACTTEEAPVDEQSPALEDKFEEASRAYDVPADLLKAISYVETHWQMVEGTDELGRPGGDGVFALWGDNLTHGAADAGLDEDVVRHDVRANIMAAAARLAELARDRGVSSGVSGDDLAAWAPVIGDFAQNADPDGRAAYIADVGAVLTEGASFTAEDGTVVAAVVGEHRGEFPGAPSVALAGSTDYANAVWRPSPNFNSRNGYSVSLIVIHDCEGAYSSCWSWLRNTAAQASAHYVVKETGTEVTQLVREANRAWHVAATYECSRAGNAQCNRNGVSVNNFAVGIEHGGFASQHTWPAGQIETSAKLSCDIAKRHGVPRDRNHIVSHGQLQPWNRTDPGPNWPWSHYIDRVRTLCGDNGGGGTTPAIVIDSNNANNNQSVAKVELAGTWTSSAATPGYFGTGYWYANTAATSAPATFWFFLPTAATKTVDAWWTAGANRASAAPFIAFNTAGTEVGRKSVDQRANGSKWVTLGTWHFTAGWNKVELSRWTTSGDVVIADAVRVR